MIKKKEASLEHCFKCWFRFLAFQIFLRYNTICFFLLWKKNVNYKSFIIYLRKKKIKYSVRYIVNLEETYVLSNYNFLWLNSLRKYRQFCCKMDEKLGILLKLIENGSRVNPYSTSGYVFVKLQTGVFVRNFPNTWPALNS